MAMVEEKGGNQSEMAATLEFKNGGKGESRRPDAAMH
jgi:hypothetical protein